MKVEDLMHKLILLNDEGKGNHEVFIGDNNHTIYLIKSIDVQDDFIVLSNEDIKNKGGK